MHATAKDVMAMLPMIFALGLLTAPCLLLLWPGRGWVPQAFRKVQTAACLVCLAAWLVAVVQLTVGDQVYGLWVAAACLPGLAAVLHLVVQTREALQSLSRDPHTGLLHKSALLDLGERLHRQADTMSVIALDLNGLKRYNDTYGHLAGDRMIAATAEALRAAVRQADLVGRFGGDEFVVVLPNTHAEGARAVAERIRAAVYKNSAGLVAACLGIAWGSAAEGNFLELLLQADQALYRAKAHREQAGRVERYDTPDLQPPVLLPDPNTKRRLAVG